MTDLALLKKRNTERWAKAKLTRGPEFIPVAKRLVAAKQRFEEVEAITGVPWYVIAVIKEREAGADPNWLCNIAQGDAWNRASIHVPKGRGPFNSWKDAAVDALVNCAPYAARNRDWSIGGLLTLLEQYNGLGYANKGIPSPYVWSGTNQYLKGKYVSDGVFDPDVVDKQLGCAGLLLAMKNIDPAIELGGPPPKNIPVTPIPVPVPKPSNSSRNSTVVVIGAAGAATATVMPDFKWIAIVGVITIFCAIVALVLWPKRTP